ncbi:electron transport complex subunit RsxG [Gallaecimonas sp. GXIMD1310]|uniref:electron transport complex subunit RsxG n=1 Tax=Gallaecimonas sp. GXIMD1310 TaxID=3131926 RepID=UPI003872FD8A
MLLSAARKNGLILGAFALAATALLAGTYQLTKGRIAEQKEAQKLAILNALIAPSSHDNSLFNDCTLVHDRSALGSRDAMPVYRARKQGAPVAIAMQTVAPDGYSGAISLMVAMQYPSGTLLGVDVLEDQETPGLGDKIEKRKSDWLTHFVGTAPAGPNDPNWGVKKDGGQFDQFTGATITPRAVVKAVGKAVLYFRQHKQALFAAPSDCGGSQ